MANVFIKPEKIISQGLGLLQRELVLPRLVTRYGVADFKGDKNDTINIKIPSLLAAREYTFRTRSAPITVDELNEQTIPVTLNKHVYSAVGVTDEELTLDIASWGEQVAAPQIRAVAEKLESYVAVAMEAADTLHSVTFDPDTSDSDDKAFYLAAVKARRYLNEQNVPVAGRFILLGSAAEEAALQSPHLIKANEAGTDSALREAVIGRIAGFTVISSNSVPEDFAIAAHATAFALGVVAPEVPQGASAGGTLVYDSLGMRWVRDYDSDYLRDRSVYSAFAGAASVEDGRNLDTEDADFGELTGKNVRAVLIDYVPGS